MKVLSLPDTINQTWLEFAPVYGSAGVILQVSDLPSTGVSSVAANAPLQLVAGAPNVVLGIDTSVFVLTVAVAAPLQLIAGPPNVQLGIDTTAISGGTVVRANKNMAASVTTADGQLACATAVATTPTSSSAAGGYVTVFINGVQMIVGDATKVGVECYFSGDGGTTARAMKAIVAGDLLYFNGSVAGYQLAASDRVGFFYPVTT